MVLQIWGNHTVEFKSTPKNLDLSQFNKKTKNAIIFNIPKSHFRGVLQGSQFFKNFFRHILTQKSCMEPNIGILQPVKIFWNFSIY